MGCLFTQSELKQEEEPLIFRIRFLETDIMHWNNFACIKQSKTHANKNLQIKTHRLHSAPFVFVVTTVFTIAFEMYRKTHKNDSSQHRGKTFVNSTLY